MTQAIPIGPGSALEGFGDKAYSWIYNGSDVIRFRKGNAIVTINADLSGACAGCPPSIF